MANEASKCGKNIYHVNSIVDEYFTKTVCCKETGQLLIQTISTHIISNISECVL